MYLTGKSIEKHKTEKKNNFAWLQRSLSASTIQQRSKKLCLPGDVAIYL